MNKTIHTQAYCKLIENLRQTRLVLHMRQEDAGRQLGVTRHWLRKVERCELRLDIVRFVLLCRVYGLDPSLIIRRLAKELSK